MVKPTKWSGRRVGDSTASCKNQRTGDAGVTIRLIVLQARSSGEKAIWGKAVECSGRDGRRPRPGDLRHPCRNLADIRRWRRPATKPRRSLPKDLFFIWACLFTQTNLKPSPGGRCDISTLLFFCRSAAEKQRSIYPLLSQGSCDLRLTVTSSNITMMTSAGDPYVCRTDPPWVRISLQQF